MIPAFTKPCPHCKEGLPIIYKLREPVPCMHCGAKLRTKPVDAYLGMFFGLFTFHSLLQLDLVAAVIVTIFVFYLTVKNVRYEVVKD